MDRRECWVITEADYLDCRGQWPQLRAAIRIVGHRQTDAGDMSHPRYYISSLAASAEQLLAAIRSHLTIENSLHWTLDVSFREDQCRVRKDHGQQNMNTLQQIGHNLLKNEEKPESGYPGQTAQRCMGRGLPTPSPLGIRRDCPADVAHHAPPIRQFSTDRNRL